MLLPRDHFRFCPRCGTGPREPQTGPAFQCARCAFVYYFNPTVAVAAFVQRPGGEVLFIRRAHEPAKGKLALPGGFVDIGETAEVALRREIREEVGLEVGRLEFLGSETNEYCYREVRYPVLDLFFETAAAAPHQAAALDGVEALCWLDPRAVASADIAFVTIRRALAAYVRRG